MERRTTRLLRCRLPGRPGRLWLREARRTGNPLLRRPTRAERLVAGAGLSLLALTAIGVILFSLRVFVDGRSVEGRQAASRTTATATVDSQPITVTMGPQSALPAFASVTYLWHGSPRSGMVPVTGSARPGDRVRVWLDAAGVLTQPPRSRAETVFDAVETGALGMAGLAVASYHGCVGYRRWWMHRRSALWDTEWLHFVAHGPADGL